MFGKGEKWAYKYRDELLAAGVVWYMYPGRAYSSKSGKPVRRKMLHFFPSVVRAWWLVKCEKGEI
jgi:hypothetical protein